MQISSPASEEEFLAYYDLRWSVLRAPWQQPRGSEKDAEDEAASTVHLMVRTAEGRVLAVGRLSASSPDRAQIRYMAVASEHRGRGLGRAVLQALEDRALRLGWRRIELHARSGAVAFYEANGYRVVAPSHTLFGTIQHFLMTKDV